MTSSLKLQRYDGTDGIEILINAETGESYCSVRGYARMSGKSESVIRERVTTARDNANLIAEVLTATGFKTARLITEDQIVEWLPKDNPAAATALLKMGVRMALHKMAGFEVKSTAIPTVEPIDPIDAKIQQAIALASAGPLAVEAFKILHGDGSAPKTPKPPKEPKSAKTPIAPPPSKTDSEVIDEFLADLKVLIDAGIVGSWNVTTVNRRFRPYMAIALHTVVPAMEKHFDRQIDRARLEAAIVATGGQKASTQRFTKDGSDLKRTQSKCALIPARSA